MAKHANQKTITIKREVVKKGENNFLTIKFENINRAMKELSGNGFKVYVYLCENKDGYKFDLSTAALEKATGVPAKNFNRTREELVQKGYLIELGGNSYEFREIGVPQNEESIPQNEEYVPQNEECVPQNVVSNNINNINTIKNNIKEPLSHRSEPVSHYVSRLTVSDNYGNFVF